MVGCKVLSKIRSLLMCLAKTMVFADVTVFASCFSAAQGPLRQKADRSVPGRLACKNNESDLPSSKLFYPLGRRII